MAHKGPDGKSIDLRRPEGVETFLTLVTSADVVVENFKPGTLAGWGIGYDDCQKVKQDIVYLSVSGWGQFGPESQRPGYDPGALALVSSSEDTRGLPVPVKISSRSYKASPVIITGHKGVDSPVIT